MDWNGLKVVMSVVATGSLTGAAAQLGVNHSTVYRRLQNFEQEVGTKLFELRGNRYELTPLGEALVAVGQTIEEKYADIERLIVGKDFQPQGLVRITAPYNLANRYLSTALAPFRHRYPDISVEILSSNQEVNMNSRIADIAVRATATPPEHLVGRQVASFGWGFFAHRKLAKKIGQLETYEQLGDYPLIGGAGHMQSLPAFIWLEKLFSSRIQTRCDELTSMSYFAESGHGIALLPFDQKRSGIECILPIAAIPASQLWLLTHPDLRQTERVRLVMQCLTDYFGSLAD